MVMMSGFGVGELDGKLIHRAVVLIYLTFFIINFSHRSADCSREVSFGSF